MGSMVKLNKQTAHSEACASHAFCDSNEVMLEAFKAAFNRDALMTLDDEVRVSAEQACARYDAGATDGHLINEAWNLVRVSEFSVTRVLASARAG